MGILGVWFCSRKSSEPVAEAAGLKGNFGNIGYIGHILLPLKIVWEIVPAGGGEIILGIVGILGICS